MSDWRTLHELRKLNSAINDPTGAKAFYKLIIGLVILAIMLYPKVKKSYEESHNSTPWPAEKALKYSKKALSDFCGSPEERNKNREQCERIDQRMKENIDNLKKEKAEKK